MLFQVVAIYLFSYFLKTHDWWRKDYTAAYYALRLDFFRRPLGDFLLMFPEVLRILTWSTRTPSHAPLRSHATRRGVYVAIQALRPYAVWWEALGGACYVIPFGNDYWRLFTCIAFISAPPALIPPLTSPHTSRTVLHLGFGLSLRLGTFMWIGIVGQFGLIPGWFWCVTRLRGPRHVA